MFRFKMVIVFKLHFIKGTLMSRAVICNLYNTLNDLDIMTIPNIESNLNKLNPAKQIIISRRIVNRLQFDVWPCS